MGYFRKPAVGKPPYNPGNRRPPGRLERREIWLRTLKRAMKAKGLLPRKLEDVWSWSLGSKSGFVSALTRSEARAKIKETLGLKRLPPEIKVEKIVYISPDQSVSPTSIALNT